MASEGDPPVEHSHSSKGEISASFLRAARGGNLDKVLELLRGGTDINTSNANGLNALHLASKEGHSDVVRELLKRKANVDAATRKGNTALHIASLAGQSLIVTILVENGANVNVQSLNGFTPLYMAAQENHEDVVRFLLTHGANQALSTEDGFTPLAVALQQGHDRVVALLLENDTKGKVRLPALHIAAKKDDTKAATLLLQNDHNADVTSKSGFTPLHIAAHYGNENVAQLLIEKGANVNYTARHNISPLHVATKWGRANMVQLLLQHGAVIDSRTRDLLTPLHCAARSGHDQVVDMLLEKGAPISAKTKNGLAPLHMAAQGDHVDSARILLYHRAPVDDVTVDYLTPLHVAAHCGHVRVAKLLLDRNADPNARALNGFTPLHIACKKNRIKVVELLLKYHASIEATTESGLSPLHVASFMGAINIVIYLLQQGANPDVATVRGETPLHLAARANQTDVVRVLIRNGAKVDAQARELQTPLHIASRLGNTDIVVLLLQAGANANSATRDQYTPLHIAAKEGQEEVAAILLDHGADKTLLTKKGFTPLHLASKYGNVEVVKLLLEKGCTVDIEGKNQVTPLHVAAHYNNDKVAMLLLEHGASAKAAAKNGYTPLHIAAKKNQMDIAGTLLQYHGDPNAKSRAGFTPLHLASQEGHKDMAALLIENGSDVGAKANNGLTSMHLCAQEDHVPVAEELYRHHAEINPQTNAGYTPLHVACHFGQINMVRFLVEHGANVSEKTRANFTPLHQAAQQGHNNVVRYLLDHGASPNEKNSQGQTPLAIAQRLGYVSVVETLKTVTETTVITETTTVHEDKYKPQNPEAMNETMFSESEDEGAAAEHETAAAHVKDFSDNLTQGLVDEQAVHHISFSEHQLLNKSSELENSKFAPEAYHDNLDEVIRRAQAQPLHTAPIMNDSLMDKSIQNDNIPIGHNVAQPSFLISFLVDARGGAMRGCRHSGVRIIVPPRKASQPIRVTCRYLRKDKLAHPPPLSEGEELASRILEMAPAGAKFLGPVILEVPHFASLRDREREIVILRSDDGQHWKEHQLEATEDAVQEVLNESFDAEELAALDDLQTPRITRILTNDFPMYFAVVTRVRQEVHCVGPEGGVIVSSVVPRVQAIFPDGSLTKTIKVSVQAQPVPQEMVTRLHGNRVAVSPIVTVEPRRRKFHKPITLCIPLPQSGNKAMLTQYSGQPGQEPPTLRLLCSITGGSAPAQWEDITGTTQLTFTGEEVSFTTTVSARFWLMDCQTPRDAARMAQEVYNEAISIPYMAKFAVFARRTFPVEGQLRVFCMTDDKEDKTLEKQEHFKLIAKSRDVEVLKGKHQFLEFAGNLVPVTKSGDQLSLFFQPFQENRLAFMVKTRNKDDSEAETEGRIAFMREPKNRSEALPPQAPICTLAITLPEYTGELPTPVVVKRDTTPFDQKYRGVLDKDLPDFIHQNVLKGVGPDWQRLARALEVPHRDIQQVRQKYPGKELPHILKIWIHLKGKEEATPENLDNALKRIGRDDIVRSILHGEPETLSYGSESPSSKRFEKYESAPLEPSKKYVDLPPVSGVSEPIVVTRHVVHHEESHTEEPHQTSSVAYKEADALPVAQRATPLRSEEAEPVTQTIPEEEEEEAPVSEVRTVVRTERHVHDTDEGPVVEERTITTTYEDDVAVNEHVVDRTVPLTEEEQEKWDSLHKEAEASLGGKLESSHTLPEGVEQEVETEQHVEDDGTIVTTTTMTSHYTETRSESPMEKIYEEDALQASGHTDSSADSGTTQKKETAEEGFTNEDGSVVVSKKMTRVVTTTKTTLPGEGEAAPESPTESLGSVKDRIAKFEQLKEGDRTSVTSLASSTSGERVERSSLDRIPVDIVVTPVSPVPPQEDEEDEIAEAQEPLSPSVEEISQAEVKSLDSYGDEKDISPPMTDRSQEIILERTEEEQEPLSPDTDRSSSAELLANEPESARKHKKREILEQSTTTTYDFSTSKEDRRYLQRGDEGEHPEEHLGEHDKEYTHEKALESPEKETSFHRAETTFAYQHETSPREDENPSAFDKLKGFGKVAAGVVAAPVALASVGAAAIYDKLRGDDELHDDHPEIEPAPAISELIRQAEEPVTPLQKEHPVEEEEKEPHTRKEIFEQSTTTTYDFTTSKEDRRQLEHEEEGEQPEEGFEERPHHMTETVITESYYEEPSPRDKGSVHEEGHEPQHVIETTKIVREISYEEPKEGEKFHEESIHEPHHIVETTTTTREYDEPASPSASEKDASTRSLKDWSPEKEEHHSETHHIVETTTTVREIFYEKPESPAEEREPLEEVSALTEKELEEPEEEKPHHVIETTTTRREYGELEEKYSPKEEGSVSTDYIEEKIEEQPHHVIETTTITREIFYDESESPTKVEEHPKSLVSPDESKVEAEVQPSPLHEEVVHDRVPEHYEVEEQHKPHHFIETTTIRREYYEPEEEYSPKEEEPATHLEEKLASPSQEEPQNEENDEESTKDKLLGLAKGVGKVIAAPVALAAVGAAAAYEKLRGESDEEENLPELQQFEQHKEAGHDESKTPSPTIEERPYHVIETTTIRSEYDEPEERYSPEEKGPVSTAHVEEEVEERPHHVIETTAITKEYYEEPEETSSSPAGNEKESIHSIKEQKTQEDLSSGIIESEPYEEEPHPHIIETTKIVKETFYDEPEAVQEKVPEEEEKLHHIVETTTITREFYEPEERAVSPGEEPVEETDAPHHVVETITTIKEIVYDEPEAEFPVKSEKESLHEEPITPVEQEHHIIETTTTTREYYEEPEQISAEEPTAEHHEPHHIVKTITTEKHYFEEPEDEEKPHHTVETITVTREIVSEPTTPEEQEPVEEHTVIEEPHHIIDTTTTTREYDEESEDKDHPEEHRHVIETTTVTREAYYDEPEAFESPVVSERKSEHVSEILSPAPSPVEQPDTHFETEEGEEYSLLKRTSLPKQEQFAEPPPPYKERESPAGHEEEEEGESTKDKILGFAKGAGKVAAGIIAAPVALAAVGAAAAYDKLKGEGEEPSPVHEEHRFEEHFEKEEPHPAHEEHLFEPSPVRESTHEEKASKPVTPSEEEHHEIHRVVETITTRRETFGDEEQHIVETTTTSHEYYEPESPMKESEHYEEQPSPAKGSIHEEKVSPIVEHTEPLMSEKEPFHKEEKPTIHDEKVSEPASPVKEHFEESAHYEDQPLKSSSRESIHEEKVSEPTSLAESPIVREKEPTHEEHEQAHRPHHIETTVVTKETFYDETGSPTVSEKEIPSEVASTHSSHHDNARDVQITTKTREYFDEPIEGHEKAISPGEEHRRVIETTTTVKETFYDEGSNRASPASSEKEPEEENEEEEEHREPYHVVETTTTVKEYYDEPSEGQKEILEERSFEERSIPEEPEEPLRLVDTTTTKREYFEEEPETGHAHEIHRVVETTTVTRETFYDETPESERPVVESASPIEEHKEMEPPVGQQSIEEYHEPKPHQDERHFEPPPPYTEKESPITEHQEVEEDEESTKDKIFGFAKGAGKIAAGIIAAPVALAAVGAAAAYEKLKGDSDEEDNFLEEHKDYPAHEELLLEEMSPATHEAHTEEQQPLATPAQEKPYIIESSSPTKEFHEEPSSPGLAKREADFDESEIEEHKIHHIVETTTVTREYDEAEEKEEEPHHVVETTVTTREAYFDEPSTPEEQKVFEEEKPEDLHKVVVSTTETKDYFEEPHDEEKKEDEEDLHESRHVIETTTVTKETFYDENEPADENEFPHHIVETTTTTKEYFDEPSTPETKEEEQEIERPHHVETTTTTKEYFYDEPAEESVHEQENIQETYPDKITETTTTVRDYFEEPAEEEEEKPHHVVETTTTVKETFFDEPTQAEEHPEEPHVLETTVTAKYTDEPSEKEEEPQVEIVSREEQPHVIESTSYETEAQYDEPSSPVVKEKHFEEAEDYQQGLESPAESEEEEGASSTKKKSLGSKIFGFAKKAGVAVVAPVALAAHALSSKDQKDIQGKEVMHEGEERVYTFQGQETESDESAQASPEVLRKAESPREEEHVIPSDEYEAPTTTALPLDQESLVSSEGYIIESQTYEDLSQTPATSIKVDTVADEEEEEDRLPEEETHVIPSTDYHPSHHEEQIHIDSRTEWPIAEEEEETHVIPSEDYHPSHHEEQIHIDSRTEWPIAEEEYIIESTPYEDYGTIEAVHEPEEEILERRQSIVKRELSDEEDDKSITTTTTGTTIIEQPIHFEEEIHEPEFEVGEKPGTPTSTDSRIIHDVPEETSPSQKSTEEEYREQVIPTITKDIYHFEEEELEDHFEEKQQESPKEGTAPVVSGVTAEGEPIISGHVSSPPSPVRHIPGTVIYHEEELQREPATQEEQFYTEESRFEPPPAYTEKESPEHHEVQQPEEEEESTSDKLFGFAKGVGKVAAGIIAAPVALAAVGAVAAYDKLKGGEEEEDEESFLDKPIPTQVQKTPATPVKDEQAPSSPTPSLEEPIHHEIETISARTTEEATIFEKPAVSEKEFVPEEASPAESEKQFIEEEHERAHHVIETTTITREYYDEPEEKRTPEEEHHDEEHHHRHVVETTTTVKEIVFDEPESPTKEEEEKLISPVESETHLETETERPGHLLETTTFTREYDEPSNLASPSESEKDFLKPQAEPYAGTTEPSRTESPVQEEEKDEVVPDQPTDIHREFLEEHDPHHIVETTTITREYYEDPTEEDLSSPTQERPVEDVLETHHEPHHVVETTTITTEKFYHEEPEEGREEEIYTMKRPSVTEITTITVDKHYLPESEEIQTERTSLSETPVESEFPPTEQGEDHMESSEIHDHPINDEHIREELEPHHHVIETTTIVTESRYVDEHHEETTPVVAGITAEGEPIISGHVSSPPSPGRHVTEEFHHEELQREQHPDQFYTEEESHFEPPPSISEKESPVTEHEGYQPEEEDEESTKDKILGFAKGAGKIAAGIIAAPVALAAVGAAAAYEKLKGESDEEEDNFLDKPVPRRTSALEEDVVAPKESPVEQVKRSFEEEEHHIPQDLEHTTTLTSTTQQYTPEKEELSSPEEGHKYEKFSPEDYERPVVESADEEDHQMETRFDESPKDEKASIQDEYEIVEEQLSPESKLEISDFVTDVVEEATAGAVIEATEELTPRSQKEDHLQSLEELALENVNRMRIEQEDETGDHLHSLEKQSEESPSSDQDESRLIAGDDEWKVYDSTGQVVEEFSAQLTDKAIEEAGSDVTQAFSSVTPGKSRSLVTQESINDVSMEPEVDYHSDLQEKLDILAGQKSESLPMVREEELDVIRESDGESEEHDPIAETASRLVDEVIETVLEEQEGPRTTSDLFYSATEKSTKDDQYDTCVTSQEDTYDTAQGWTSQDSEYTTATSEAPSRLSEMDDRTEGTTTPQAAISPVDSDRQFVVDLDNEGRPRPMRSFTLDDETARSTPDVALQITIEEEEEGDETLATSPSGVLLGPNMDPGRPISPVPPRKQAADDEEEGMFVFVAKETPKDLESVDSVDIPEPITTREVSEYTRHSSDVSSESRADTVIHKEHEKDDQTSLDEPLTSTRQSEGSSDSLDKASIKSTGRLSSGSSIKAAEEPLEPVEKDSPRSQDLSPEQPKSSIGSADLSPRQESPQMEHQVLETEEGFVIYHQGEEGGELETVEEEPEDSDSLNGGSGNSSVGAPVNLGKYKHVSSDNVSLTSLQEFERLEQLVASRGDNSLTASEIELYASGRPRSMEGSLSSLAEFEKLEQEAAHQANLSPHDEMMLSVVKEESEAEDMSIRDDDEEEVFSETELKTRPVNEEENRASTPQALSPTDSLERDLISNMAMMETSADSLEPSFQSKPTDIMADSLTEYEVVPRMDSTRDSLENIPQDKDSLLEGASQDLASQETHGLLSGDTVGTYQEHDDDDKDSLGGEMESMLRSYPTTLTTFETTTVAPDGSIQTISRRVETRVVDPVMSHVTFTGTESQERLNQLPLEQPIETVDAQGNVTRTLFKKQPPHSE